MGRVTYEALAGFSAAATDETSVRMSNIPKFVFSKTLKEPLAWTNTHLRQGDLADEITALKQQRAEPLRSIGSVSLVQSMMRLGLVDRLRLMIFPLILGSAGREPIFAGYPLANLELNATKVLDARIILLEYRPVRGTAA
jgi:dihydrofolate reductase